MRIHGYIHTQFLFNQKNARKTTQVKEVDSLVKGKTTVTDSVLFRGK